MLDIMMILGPILFACIIVYIIFELIKRGIEIKKFNAMIDNMNDATVLEYIEAFRRTRNFGTRYGTANPQLSLSDKMRQAQGWEAVKESANVSDEVKDKMGKLFVKERIIVKL